MEYCQAHDALWTVNPREESHAEKYLCGQNQDKKTLGFGDLQQAAPGRAG
jgi:hypothetical protein